MPAPTADIPDRRARARLCLTLAALAALPAGCARDVRPATAQDAARIRAACPPGSFVAAMASNCPEIVR